QEGRSRPRAARPGAAAGRVLVRPFPLPTTSWFAEGGRAAAAGRVAGTGRRGRGRGRRRRGAVPARPRRAPWAGRRSEQRVPGGVRACGRGATAAPQRHVTMDRRTREDPERTFDLVLKVKCHASENEGPVILWKFPEDFGDQEVLQSVPKFCFPFDVERASQNQVGQHFTFVLTDIESKQRFGFCRLTSGGRICLCILSYLPWFEVYYKLLNTLADYLAKELEDDLNETLKSLYNHPVPKANTPVNLSVNQELFIASEQVLKDQPSLMPHSCFIAPDITGLPTIPESRNLTEYFVAVDVNNMLRLYASMLHERRIIITSSKLSTVSLHTSSHD
ncbi:DENN domain-containing protein 1B, partial [Lemmus lemmus]